MERTPSWVPILFGGALLLMGGLILGALLGLIPTEGGQFLAPVWVIAGLGLGLLLGGLALWVPPRAPGVIRSALFISALALGAAVCNWTAFAPGVVYESTTSPGPVTISAGDQVGGRIAFGMAALAIDAFLISALIGWARARAPRR